MTEIKRGRGGAREGAGRKPDSIKRSYVKVRLSVDEHAKLMKLGGSKWLVEHLAKAEVNECTAKT